MITVFALILFWNNGYAGASSTVYYQSESECEQKRTEVLRDWNDDGSVSNGMAGRISSICLEAKLPTGGLK